MVRHVIGEQGSEIREIRVNHHERSEPFGCRPEGLELGFVERLGPHPVAHDATQQAQTHRPLELGRRWFSPVLEGYVADAPEVIGIGLAEGRYAVIRHPGDVVSRRTSNPVVKMRGRGRDERHVETVVHHILALSVGIGELLAPVCLEKLLVMLGGFRGKEPLEAVSVLGPLLALFRSDGFCFGDENMMMQIDIRHRVSPWKRCIGRPCPGREPGPVVFRRWPD